MLFKRKKETVHKVHYTKTADTHRANERVRAISINLLRAVSKTPYKYYKVWDTQRVRACMACNIIDMSIIIKHHVSQQSSKYRSINHNSTGDCILYVGCKALLLLPLASSGISFVAFLHLNLFKMFRAQALWLLKARDRDGAKETQPQAPCGSRRDLDIKHLHKHL